MSSVAHPELFPLHFIGIGGIGMSGIAELFFHRGFPVSGSDSGDSETTKRLRSLGIDVSVGHHAESVHGKKVVVISSAIRPSNPEVQEAKRLRIPVIPRAEMLGELMRGKTAIALAGTHGKTTTTSLTSTVLSDTGWDPTCVIGGKVDALGGNAKSGKSEYVVAEADESDGSFLHLPATYALVTNIDNDHLDHFHDQNAIDRAFIQFTNQIPFYGRTFLCGDDVGVKRILSAITKPYLLYGFEPENDFVAKDIEYLPGGTTFDVHQKNAGVIEHLGSVRIAIPGRHNVLNALGVTALCLHLGVPFADIARALEKFAGVKRRFETVYHDTDREIRIVDDYGHHPTEIAATLRAARSIWKGRIICVFQPHRYSRTQNSAREFQSCFTDADHLIVTEIYSAGEDPIPGISGASLTQSVSTATGDRIRTEFIPTMPGVKARVLELLKPGDLVLCMGAGSITHLPAELRASLA